MSKEFKLKLSPKAMDLIDNNPGLKYMYQQCQKSMSCTESPNLHEDDDDAEYELAWKETDSIALAMTAVEQRKEKRND